MARKPSPKDIKIDPPEVIDKLEARCLELATEYINELEDPEDMKTNNGLFVDMLKDIYNKYLIDVLQNNHDVNNRYDYKTLDKIFNIYTKLVYRYKQNKRPNILEFTIFTHINRQTLYNAVYNHTQKLTNMDIQMVKRWFTECENCLVNGNSVFEIFLLKSQYRYNDNMQAIPIESQGHIMSAAELPNLGIDTAIIDNNTQSDVKKIPDKVD